jgi:regulator of protease activity HflC (stomatin/prohibitin superfamily)
MSHEHKHDHEHEHHHDHAHEHGQGDMHEYEHEREPVEVTRAQGRQGEDLDAAGKSLSNALRISFAILKVIMIVLVIGFIASGFRTVQSGEKGIILRFGKIHRITAKPGSVWVLPYPIDELIRIPADRRINLPVNAFWYKETREDIMGPGTIPRNYRADSLDPLQEGYCLTRSEKSDSQVVAAVRPVLAAGNNLALAAQSDGSDYSIVHTRWQIDYQINNVDQFFRNVYVAEVKPGQVYFDIMTQSITPMLRSVIEDAVVQAMVHYTIDEAIQSIDTIPGRVQQLAQKKLTDLGSGITVTSVRLVKAEWPKQVDQAFAESIAASQRSQATITEARTYAENTLNEVAGLVARQLYQGLVDGSLNDQQCEALWAQAAGQTRDRLAQAEAYKTTVVETAKADSDYLMKLLPEYQKRPELVARGLYAAAIEDVLTRADEKFIIELSEASKDRQVRINLSREPVKPKRAGQQPPAPK